MNHSKAARLVLRMYLLLVSAVLFFPGAVLVIIGSGSLSAIGNSNPLSAAIPDDPDSWVIIALGFYFTALSTVQCGFACMPCRSCGICSHLILCNSGVAFVGSVVMLVLNLNGVPILQPSAWRALGQDSIYGAANDTSGLHGLAEFASAVLPPDALLYFSIALVPTLTLALLANICVIYLGSYERSEAKRTLMSQQAASPRVYKKRPIKANAVGVADTRIARCEGHVEGDVEGAGQSGALSLISADV